MRVVYMRHGEPQRLAFDELGLVGFGRDLAPLAPQGIALAGAAAKSPLLDGAELIVSSPLTRALQTAAIVAGRTGLLVEAELGLVERRVDLSQGLAFEAAKPLFVEYDEERGVWPDGETRNWESVDMQRERLRAALDKYLRFSKIIVVAHGELSRRLRPGGLGFCEMFEFEYARDFEFLPWSERP